jgi:hypothetical protein
MMPRCDQNAGAGPPATDCFSSTEAEGEGFEPSSDPRARNGFRDRRIRPLCHPSEGTHRVPAAAGGRLYVTVMFCFIPAASWPGTVQ